MWCLTPQGLELGALNVIFSSYVAADIKVCKKHRVVWMKVIKLFHDQVKTWWKLHFYSRTAVNVIKISIFGHNQTGCFSLLKENNLKVISLREPLNVKF